MIRRDGARICAASALLALILSACGGSGQPAAQPGDPAVYARINASRDCAALQAEFDTAAANHDHAVAGSDAAVWATAYMSAAFDRMKSLGCP